MISNEEGIDTLLAILEDLGIATERATTPDGPDVTIRVPGGDPIRLDVQTVSTADVSAVDRLTNRPRPRAAESTVLVADRIPSSSRAVLSRSGVNWFDRRGHLHLIGPGVMLDMDIDPAERLTGPPAEGVRGRAGVAYAAAVLLSPTDPPGIREAARQAGLSPSSVSTAAASLRRAALIADAGGPLIPDLFWALAEQWRPRWVHLGRSLDDLIGQAERLGIFGGEHDPGWAVSGDIGAASYGAPIVMSSSAPPQLYVPGERVAALARRALGEADWHERSCSIAVAPIPAVCVPRRSMPDSRIDAWGPFLLTRPLFVALDLAQDAARGREILEGWTPPDGARVW